MANAGEKDHAGLWWHLAVLAVACGYHPIMPRQAGDNKCTTLDCIKLIAQRPVPQDISTVIKYDIVTVAYTT